ncbi:hypothetical protein EMPG_12116 [Blastomyces silverae]|uniref:Uncharacterized protein n=1 Tax=Blastomyces silverae TaxID=2060906 RepID=A0A0H1BNM0_9EURO|nr:hypothetical protein EMPG_12116 [Blastomyces silverae]
MSQSQIANILSTPAASFPFARGVTETSGANMPSQGTFNVTDPSGILGPSKTPLPAERIHIRRDSEENIFQSGHTFCFCSMPSSRRPGLIPRIWAFFMLCKTGKGASGFPKPWIAILFLVGGAGSGPERGSDHAHTLCQVGAVIPGAESDKEPRACAYVHPFSINNKAVFAGMAHSFQDSRRPDMELGEHLAWKDTDTSRPFSKELSGSRQAKANKQRSILAMANASVRCLGRILQGEEWIGGIYAVTLSKSRHVASHSCRSSVQQPP